MLLHLQCNGCGIGLQLPATPAIVRQTFGRLREGLKQDAPVEISGVGDPVSFLRQYIQNVDLTNTPELETLNQLSEQVDGMSTQEQHILWGALDAESVNGLDDVLRVASSLEQYQLVEGVASHKQLGGWLVEHGLAGVDFPESVRPYLDYAGIGAEYCAGHGGAYTPSGYVKRREIDRTQAAENKSKITIELISGFRTWRLDLPFSEDELSQARQSLGVSEIHDGMICAVENGYLWSGELPTDDLTLDGANTLARYVLQMSETELKIYGAVLEAEEPAAFSDALCIAEDIDDYELVEGSEGEYGREALRKAGADDEVLEILDGFTDFDALGRAEMEADGVRETSYGLVKRLSSPFSHPEIGPTMC